MHRFKAIHAKVLVGFSKWRINLKNVSRNHIETERTCNSENNFIELRIWKQKQHDFQQRCQSYLMKRVRCQKLVLT